MQGWLCLGEACLLPFAQNMLFRYAGKTAVQTCAERRCRVGVLVLSVAAFNGVTWRSYMLESIWLCKSSFRTCSFSWKGSHRSVRDAWWRTDERIRHLGVRGDAAANQSGHGGGVLREVDEAFPDSQGSGRSRSGTGLIADIRCYYQVGRNS